VGEDYGLRESTDFKLAIGPVKVAGLLICITHTRQASVHFEGLFKSTCPKECITLLLAQGLQVPAKELKKTLSHERHFV